MSRFYAFLEKRGFEEQSDFFFFFKLFLLRERCDVKIVT